MRMTHRRATPGSRWEPRDEIEFLRAIIETHARAERGEPLETADGSHAALLGSICLDLTSYMAANWPALDRQRPQGFLREAINPQRMVLFLSDADDQIDDDRDVQDQRGGLADARLAD